MPHQRRFELVTPDFIQAVRDHSARITLEFGLQARVPAGHASGRTYQEFCARMRPPLNLQNLVVQGQCLHS